MQNIKLLPEIEKYIRLQRTRFQKNELYNEQNFLKMIHEEMETLEPFFNLISDNGKTIENYLDIGCGIPWIDLAIHHRLHSVNGDVSHIYLCDKDKLEVKPISLPGGYDKEHPFYNSCDLSIQFLTINGISKNMITWVDAEQENLKDLPKMDFIFSIRSWGFHYPLEVYLDVVLEILKTDGYLILDLRKNRKQTGILKDKFKKNLLLVDSQKFERWVFYN